MEQEREAYNMLLTHRELLKSMLEETISKIDRYNTQERVHAEPAIDPRLAAERAEVRAKYLAKMPKPDNH